MLKSAYVNITLGQELYGQKVYNALTIVNYDSQHYDMMINSGFKSDFGAYRVISD